MATSIDDYQAFVRDQNRRLGRSQDFEGHDPFDRVTDHDDDEVDEYSLYRLGVK